MNKQSSPSDLAYLIEISKTENLSRAAERIGISQPSLSLAVQRLENEFGVQLLIRSKTGVKLTKHAHKLVTRSKIIFEEWDKLKNEVLQDDEEVSGQFIIGCHVSVALYSLPKFLHPLLEKFKKLEIKLIHDLSRNIANDVINFKIDFGIVVNPVQHPELIIKELKKDRVTFWTAEKPSSLQKINSEENVLIYEPSLLQTQHLLQMMQKKKIKFHRMITSSSLEAIATMVSAGVGVGILPACVAEQNQSLKLRLFHHDAPYFEDRVCLIYRNDAQKSQASKKIIEFILKSFS